MDKIKIIEYLKDLNKTHKIKIDGTEEERLIFDSDEVFKIFGEFEKGVLNPFNNYSYKWLNSFLDNVVYLLGYEDFDTFEELQNEINDKIYEWCDSEVDVYTCNLTKWLNDNNDNVYYLTEALEEFDEKDGVKVLTLAQYKAIEEHFNNLANILIEHLKDKFEEE